MVPVFIPTGSPSVCKPEEDLCGKGSSTTTSQASWELWENHTLNITWWHIEIFNTTPNWKPSQDEEAIHTPVKSLSSTLRKGHNQRPANLGGSPDGLTGAIKHKLQHSKPEIRGSSSIRRGLDKCTDEIQVARSAPVCRRGKSESTVKDQGQERESLHSSYCSSEQKGKPLNTKNMGGFWLILGSCHKCGLAEDQWLTAG